MRYTYFPKQELKFSHPVKMNKIKFFFSNFFFEKIKKVEKIAKKIEKKEKIAEKH